MSDFDSKNAISDGSSLLIEVNMYQKPTLWLCDNCGEMILTAGDGWLEWIDLLETNGASQRGRSIRIVHKANGKGSCQFDPALEFARDGGVVDNGGLTDFLGPDGLFSLLEFIEGGRLPHLEVVEIIKRIHIPYYESLSDSFKFKLP
jgi:hypothetical protein